MNGQRKVLETLQFTGQFNVSGQPAASLPLHWAAGGLPIGVQLVADYGREDVLIRVAGQLEQARAVGGPPSSRARLSRAPGPVLARRLDVPERRLVTSLAPIR